MNRTESGEPGGQVFIDESKAGDYLLVAVTVLPRDLATVRRVSRRLVLPGQRRIHMVDESSARRRTILSAIVTLPIDTTIYRARKDGSRTEMMRRNDCLSALVGDAARQRRHELVLELDRSVYKRDRQHLIDACRRAGCLDRLAHRHEMAATEPALIAPDAIGWAWARGGEWRQRCEPLGVRVVDV